MKGNSPFHVRVPSGSGVNGHPQTMRLRCVGRIFEGRVERKVVRGGLAAMNVLFIRQLEALAG